MHKDLLNVLIPLLLLQIILLKKVKLIVKIIKMNKQIILIISSLDINQAIKNNKKSLFFQPFIKMD